MNVSRQQSAPTNATGGNRSRFSIKNFALFAILLCSLSTTSFAQTAQTQAQVDNLNSLITRLNVDIEAKKLAVLQAKAQPNGQRSAQFAEVEIKKLQNALAVRRQELNMWQQQANFEKQPPHANPEVQRVKITIQQLTVEKAKAGIAQLQANQIGNKASADMYAAQITRLQAQMTAKTQEIRLIELKAKAAGIPAAIK